MDELQVKAFVGALPDDAEGVEFWTDVEPSYQRPGEARWLLGSPGVMERTFEHVAIRVVLTKARYTEQRSVEIPSAQDDDNGI